MRKGRRKRYGWSPLQHALLGALCCATLSGCAHSYIDADGNRAVIGLVHLTLPATERAPAAADWMRVRTVGLSLASTNIGAALGFGYTDDVLAVVRNHSCVSTDRLPPFLLPARGVPDAIAPPDR